MISTQEKPMSWKPFDLVCTLPCEHFKSRRLQLELLMTQGQKLEEQSDNDTALPNGFDDILNEVCEKAVYESDESDEGAW
jgi:hypothetical protein